MKWVRDIAKFIETLKMFTEIKKMLRRNLLKADYWIAGKCYYLFRFLPLQDKVAASTFRGRRYGDNPKFIVEELHALRPDIDIVWLKNRHFGYELPPYIREVSFYHHIEKAYELATAKVWVYSHRLEGNVRKRKGQIFIETWHGGLGIKKIEGDVAGDFLTSKDRTELMNTVRHADLFISNSDHLTNIYRSAFGYSGPIIKCGYPKNDILFRDETPIRQKVRTVYGLSGVARLLLYAPTFRDSFETKGFDSSPYEIDFLKVKQSLEERFGDKWVVLLRWHPVMAERMENQAFDFGGSVLDATSYPDIQELIIAADAFISDYSSCMFDAAMRKIPCFIYATDFEEYSADRGTYYKLEELPFPYAKDNDELNRNIITFDEAEYLHNWDAFARRTGLTETGHAGRDIAYMLCEYLAGKSFESCMGAIAKDSVSARSSTDVKAMSKKNIVLFGLPYDNNLGDRAIFSCTMQMLQGVLDNHDAGDIEIRCVDMTGREETEYNPTRSNFLKKLSFRIPRRILWLLKNEKLLARFKYREARYVSRVLCRRHMDDNTVAVIFAGGGILKYKYQMFHRYIDGITAYADKKHIPVLMNAVGVEGYDRKNGECRLLKRAIRRKCVTYISTRDDITTLKKNYIRPDQHIQCVADPACLLAEYQPRESVHHDKPVIGLGVVREGLFADNGIAFDKEQMLELWSGIYNEIRQRGYTCKIFGNGAISDDKFLGELLTYLEIPEEDKEQAAFPRPTSVSQLADIICSFDGVITGRLHASVIAYSYGVPSVGLVWNRKQSMFGQHIGCPSRFVTREAFDPVHIVDLVESAVSQGYDETQRAVYCRTTADFMEEFVRNCVLNRL